MALLFVGKDLLVVVALALVSLFAGLFGFSFERLCEYGDYDKTKFLLGIIFFPVLMFIGVVIGFKEIFCDTAPEIMAGFCQMFRGGIT